MATQVYATEDITLQDGTDVTLKPLAIARLRRFMDAWREFENVDGDEGAGFDVFVNCAGIGLSDNFADKFDDLYPNTEQKKKGMHLNPEYKAYLEDVLDLDSIYKVLDIAGGIKLNDPKLMEAALMAASEQEPIE
jgi:hypothetical protein